MADDVPRRRSSKVTLIYEMSHRVRRSQLHVFAEDARRAARLKGEVSILLTSSEDIRALNRRFRGKNKATDVLSFPATETSGRYSGDIAISTDIAAQYAKKLRHSLFDEIRILILHGMLHLAGHDHENDEGEMAQREAALRKRFALPLSLTERASGENV